MTKTTSGLSQTVLRPNAFDPHRASLRECEAVIERGAQSFIEVGTALAAIRDRKLYRAEFSRFDDYCKERWGYAKRYAYYLMDAAEVCTVVHVSTEREARALVPLKDEPELIPVAMEKAKARAQQLDKPVTAELLSEAVAEVRPKKERDVIAKPVGQKNRSTKSVAGRLQQIEDTLGGFADALATLDLRGEDHREAIERVRQAALAVNRRCLELGKEYGDEK